MKEGEMVRQPVGEIGALRLYTDDDLPEGHWYFGCDEPAGYGSLSCRIEEDDIPPTAQQLVDGLARSAMMWGGTPSGCKGSLRLYAGQVKRYKKLLLERLGVIPSDENKILGAALKLLKRLEWGGKQYYFDDKCTLPECPVCGGDRPLGDEDDKQYRGHSKGCELASLIEE